MGFWLPVHSAIVPTNACPDSTPQRYRASWTRGPSSSRSSRKNRWSVAREIPTAGTVERRVSAVVGFVVSCQKSSIAFMGRAPLEPRIHVCAAEVLKGGPPESARSEERRVGKEGGARRLP